MKIQIKSRCADYTQESDVWNGWPVSEDSKSGVGIELIVLKERILYTGLFLPHLIFCLLHSCKQFCSILNLLRYNCVKRKITLELEFAHSLAKSKGSEYFPVYCIFFEKKSWFWLSICKALQCSHSFSFSFLFSPKDVYVGYLPLAHVLELGAGKKWLRF